MRRVVKPTSPLRKQTLTHPFYFKQGYMGEIIIKKIKKMTKIKVVLRQAFVYSCTVSRIILL